MLVQRDATRCKDVAECFADASIMGGEYFTVGNKLERECVGIHRGGVRLGPQPGPQRQQQFDPAGTAANYNNPARPVGLATPVKQHIDFSQERADGLDRNRIQFGACDRCQSRRNADVGRQQVIRNRRTTRQHDTFVGAIDTVDLGMNKPRAGRCGKANQIDMGLLRRVKTGNHARQHAGIRRRQIARDQGHADAGQRPHGKIRQYVNVRVAAADDNDILRHGLFFCTQKIYIDANISGLARSYLSQRSRSPVDQPLRAKTLR